MKKIIAIALALTMALAVTACDKDDDNNSSTAPVTSNVTSQVTSDEPKTSEEPEVTPPVDSEPEPVSSVVEPEVQEWSASDFDVYGLGDISMPEFGSEPSLYQATPEGGIIAMWEGVADMDKITAYGKALFAMTEAKGGNYSVAYNPDSMKWEYDTEYASFENAQTAWTPEYYYSEWYYKNNGILVNVAYYGEGETVTLKLFPYGEA